MFNTNCINHKVLKYGKFGKVISCTENEIEIEFADGIEKLDYFSFLFSGISFCEENLDYYIREDFYEYDFCTNNSSPTDVFIECCCPTLDEYLHNHPVSIKAEQLKLSYDTLSKLSPFTEERINCYLKKKPCLYDDMKINSIWALNEYLFIYQNEYVILDLPKITINSLDELLKVVMSGRYQTFYQSYTWYLYEHGGFILDDIIKEILCHGLGSVLKEEPLTINGLDEFFTDENNLKAFNNAPKIFAQILSSYSNYIIFADSSFDDNCFGYDMRSNGGLSLLGVKQDLFRVFTLFDKYNPNSPILNKIIISYLQELRNKYPMLYLRHGFAKLLKDAESGNSLNDYKMELYTDKDFTIYFYSEHDEFLEWLSADYYNNKTIVLNAVSIAGTELAYASDELKRDIEIVIAAVSNDPDALQFADKSLRNDPNILKAAGKK